MNLKKTALTAAIAASLGVAAAAPVQAEVITASWTGYFTMVKPNGDIFQNSAPGAYTTTYVGERTPITGTFAFNTTTGGGTATVTQFSFGSGGFALASSISMQAIGNGNCTSSGCGAGTLVLGNMGFTWGPNTAIAVSIVLDAAGFFGAVGAGVTTSQTISGVGTYAATENSKWGGATFASSATFTMGLLPMSTTEWNTSPTGLTTPCSWPACNPSGTLPLVLDTTTDSREDTTQANGNNVLSSGTVTASGKQGIGGVPMPAGPFPGYNANFDVSTIHITSVTPDVSAVPVPAAVWLFGSGLLGLVGIARRKKKA